MKKSDVFTILSKRFLFGLLKNYNKVWSCPNNCQVVSDCDGSCKNK